MFEQACNEKIQQFDDNDSDEDIWEEKEITFSQTSQSTPTKRQGYVSIQEYFLRFYVWKY